MVSDKDISEEEEMEEEADGTSAAGTEADVIVPDDEVSRLARTAAEYRNRLAYLQADFENYRKRNEREKEEFRKYANEALIIELVDVYENLERALEIARKSGDQKMTKGIEMVYGQMKSVFEKYGLKPIQAAGKKFDPHLHEAMLQEKSQDVDEDTVLEEYQRGYTLNSKVIRCAKVKVSRK
jgi:molecular chaperone GrpE